MLASMVLCLEIGFASKSVNYVSQRKDRTQECGEVTNPSSMSRGQTLSQFGIKRGFVVVVVKTG